MSTSCLGRFKRDCLVSEQTECFTGRGRPNESNEVDHASVRQDVAAPIPAKLPPASARISEPLLRLSPRSARPLSLHEVQEITDAAERAARKQQQDREWPEALPLAGPVGNGGVADRDGNLKEALKPEEIVGNGGVAYQDHKLIETLKPGEVVGNGVVADNGGFVDKYAKLREALKPAETAGNGGVAYQNGNLIDALKPGEVAGNGVDADNGGFADTYSKLREALKPVEIVGNGVDADNGDVADNGGDGGGDEEEFVDEDTNRVYDALLTHYIDEVEKATTRMLVLYYVNTVLNVLTTSLTIVLNSLMMVAKHLNIPPQFVTVFAAINMVSKGLEMRFKFGHEAQNLQSCLEDTKLLAAEAEDLLLKCKHSNLEKAEILEFKLYYQDSFRDFACYLPPREVDMLHMEGIGSKMQRLNEEEGPDAKLQDLFMDQLKHYDRQLVVATQAMLKSYNLTYVASTLLTMLTLIINPTIISANELEFDRSAIAYLALANNLVKGFELRFKFEHQKAHLEHQLEKAHVLRTECDQLMVISDGQLMSDVEIASFKRALDDALEGFAMYMLQGDNVILSMKASSVRSARGSNENGYQPLIDA